MAEYRQYCPVARAAEILADRWTTLIVRELLAGARHFNTIERGLPGISRSLLASRLRLLVDADVVVKRDGGRRNSSEYELTPAGHDLQRVLDRLGEWGVRWAFGEPRPEELDPVLLLWKMHRRIRRDRLPPSRTVVEFDFRGPGGRRLWLVLEPREISVCLKPPGFDSDLIVRADLSFFYRVWLGYVDYHAAVRSGHINIDGRPSLAREFPRWLMWSPMAHLVRAEAADVIRSAPTPGRKRSLAVTEGGGGKARPTQPGLAR
jgi:DNA-binding HxlR family transcriptional regulator